MPRLSVFTVTAVVVFLVGTCNNARAMAKPYEKGLRAIVVSGMIAVPFPGFVAVVVVANLALANRLYMHAWILDDSENYRRALKTVSRKKQLGEWLIRVVWVTATAWLPEAYGSFARNQVTVLGMSIYGYLFAIGVCLLVWDCLMKGTVLTYSQHPKDDLRANWLAIDLIVVVCLGTPWLLEDVGLCKVVGNWVLFLTPLAFIALGCTCMIQVVMWFRRIANEAKRSTAIQ